MSENHSNYSLEDLGHSIAKYRLTTGLTQAQVAEKLGLGNDAISRLERGKTDPPIGRLIAIAEIFDCPMADLLTESSPRVQDQVRQIMNLLMLFEKDEDRTEAVDIFRSIVRFKLNQD